MSRSPRPPEGHYEDRRGREDRDALLAELWKLRRQKSAMGRELKHHKRQPCLPLGRVK